MAQFTFVTPVARLIHGHPLKQNVRTDGVTKQPVLGKDGQPIKEIYIGIAIPKTGEADWKDTEWGKQIVMAALDAENGYDAATTRRPDFSWKVIDGDSDIPNKAGHAPNEDEYKRGHWVLHLNTRIPYNCYHVGKYNPLDAIQDVNAIKLGDYVRVNIVAKGNKPSKTPGVYLNPNLLELSRVGEAIIREGSGPDAASVFGGSAPAQVTPTPTPAAPAPATPPPATDLLVTPPPVVEEKYSYNGAVYTKAQLLGMPGWSEELIAQHCQKVA